MCLFRTVLTLLHLRLSSLWDSDVQPCWVTAESMYKSQEPGERGGCSVVQLIHLALRLAWPTNYLSKGHSQALCGSCSLWHAEGKRSPENPANRVLVSEGLTVTHCWILVVNGQTWARECPKPQVGSGEHQSCRHFVSRLLPSYSDPPLSLSPVCNTYRMECNT